MSAKSHVQTSTHAPAGQASSSLAAGVTVATRTRWAERPLDASLMTLFALIGIGIAAYLTIVHYAKVPVACPAGHGVVNCQAVTTSAYSVIGNSNVPITVPGIAWFVVSLGLSGTALWMFYRRRPLPGWVSAGHTVWGALGVITVIYLIYVETEKLHTFCEWCSAVHLLIILTFLIALFRWQRTAASRYGP